MAGTRRVYQIAEKIRNVVAMELQYAADPRFHMVTVTSVVVSPDLRHAKIYWVAGRGKESIQETGEAFEAAAGHFRRTLAKDLGIRFVPNLKFFYDDTLDTEQQVSELLERIRSQGSES